MIAWDSAVAELRHFAGMKPLGWKFGQNDGLRWLADRIEEGKPGVLIADEVGLGKTRIAVAAMHAVARAGGRVAVVVPPNLLHQWEAEHLEFLTALGADTSDDRATRDRRQFRAFLDAFPSNPPTDYPRCMEEPFLLISHGFGLPHQFKPNSHAYSWALPYIVRSFMSHGQDNWRGCPGLKAKMHADPRLARQIPAARWLAAHARDLQADLHLLPVLNDKSGAGFSLQAGAEGSGLQALFRTLLGRLLGQFDLIVIDEAHKSRDGADETRSTKRLSFLLEEILQPAAGCRRLALTATPVQLGASDWGSTLRRIGLGKPDLDRRLAAIQGFDELHRKFRSGPASEADVEEIVGVAERFQGALADVVVRRRWADQDIMRQAADILQEPGTHPHRRWDVPPAEVAWSALDVAHRMAFLAAEGRSLASVDTDLGLVERHRAARHAQAMDVLDQPGQDDELTTQLSETARHTYWGRVQAAWWPTAGLEGDDTLIVHPRIVAACDWIDDVVVRDVGKVLVFGSYNRPLKALSDALNIRCFLREVAAGKPTKPPNALRQREGAQDRLMDAVLQCMRDGSEIRQAVALAGGLNALIQASVRLYDIRSDGLGRDVTDALQEADVRDAHLRNVVRLAALERMIASGSDGKGMRPFIDSLLTALSASAKESGDDNDEAQAADDMLLEALRMEEELSQVGRSDFARLLNGKSSHATRHVLQALFNTPLVRPQILLAQSRVASEGLNLHRACRHVVFLHLDWNPAVIEQQLGRVDRVDSYWHQTFKATKDAGDLPRIEIATVVLNGTSDASKRDHIVKRQRMLGAHLFGEILPSDLMKQMKPEWRDRIHAASPSFSPTGMHSALETEQDDWGKVNGLYGSMNSRVG